MTTETMRARIPSKHSSKWPPLVRTLATGSFVLLSLILLLHQPLVHCALSAQELRHYQSKLQKESSSSSQSPSIVSETPTTTIESSSLPIHPIAQALSQPMFVQNEDPEFVGQVPNLTVSVGRDAKFPCIVNNLDTYRVGWIRNEDKSILTIQHQVVTRNSRISLTQSEHKIWTLHIKNVQKQDRGGYMCQINTIPMKSQIGYLDVTVPPDFVNAETSTDVMVRENQNVTLRCKADGHPVPKLSWRREDNKPIEYGNWQANKELLGFEYPSSFDGESITINKVSRIHMAAYLCIAQNGVQPSVSRRILLQVHFPPMIWVPNQLIGASVGDEVGMECATEAFPLSLNYWTKEDSFMIVNSDKFKMSNTENSYKVNMKLVIKKISSDDFGTYRCYAKNSLGSTQGSIRIYEIHRNTKTKEPSTARIQSLNDRNNGNSGSESGGKDSPSEEYYSAGTASTFQINNLQFACLLLVFAPMAMMLTS